MQVQSSHGPRSKSALDETNTHESPENELASDPMLAVFDSAIRQRLVQPPKGKGGGTVLDAEVLDNDRAPWSRERRFRVYLPANYDPGKPASMIMLLHGCNQTEEDIASISAMDLIADREHCIVVYPYVSGYLGMVRTEIKGKRSRLSRARAALVLAICMRERAPSCILAPPEEEITIRPHFSSTAFSAARVIFSPTTDPMLPPMKKKSKTDNTT